MSNHGDLQTIDPAALAQVSGGATSAKTSTSDSDQILTALTGILSSIQSIAGQRTSGGLNPQEMFMLMMVMQQRNQQPVAATSGSWSAPQGPILR